MWPQWASSSPREDSDATLIVTYKLSPHKELHTEDGWGHEEDSALFRELDFNFCDWNNVNLK